MTETKETRGKCQAIWLRYALFSLVCWAAGTILEKAGMSNFADEDWYSLVMTTVVYYVIGFSVLLLATKNIETEKPERTKKSFGTLFAALVIAMLFSDMGNVVGFPVKTVVNIALGRNVNTLNDATKMILSGSPIWNFLLAVILGPIFEELIFRKLLIDRMNKYGELTAILASALAFGLYHRSADQMFYTAAMGLVFAYVYVRTGNVFYTIGLHMANNLFSFLLAMSATLVDFQGLTGAAQAGTDASAASLATAVPVYFMLFLKIVFEIAAVIILIKKIKNKNIYIREITEKLPKGKCGMAFANIGFIAYALICIVSYYYVVFFN